MLLSIILLLIGFALVIKGADWLVDGAVSVAKKLKVSELVIGLTIVAFGTSTPELIVNLISSIQGDTEIAIGNILGSNIANILLILGIASTIYPLRVTDSTTWKEIPLSLLAVVLVGLFVNDIFLDQSTSSIISRTDGLALLAFFVIFLYYIFGISKKLPPDEKAKKEEIETEKLHSTGITILLIIAGLTALVLGGKLVVDKAIAIATIFGVSQSLIGLTVVAVGTSLPELATSAVAAYKKKSDIAVGNIVGSNIFNIFWILGLSSTITPLPISTHTNLDVMMAIFASFLLFIYMFLGKRKILDRWQGVSFIVIYISYITFLIIRG